MQAESSIRELDPHQADDVSFVRTYLAVHWGLSAEEANAEWIDPSREENTFPHILIADVREQVAGMIMLYIEPNGYLDIHNQPWITALYVDEAFRGHGIAQQLIEQARIVARRHGYATLYLDTAQAADYYRKIGSWEELGTARWEEGGKDVTIMSSPTK